MPKTLRNKTITLAFTGAVFSVVALLIFILLPDSELANSIEYSGTDALWMLALAPVFSVFGAVNFIYAFLKDKTMWSSVLSEKIVISAAGILGLMMIFNFAVYASYFFNQLKLGFVAPYSGTVYEMLQVILVVFTVLQLLFSLLSIPATSKNK